MNWGQTGTMAEGARKGLRRGEWEIPSPPPPPPGLGKVEELRAVAQTLSRAGRVLAEGTAQAEAQGQALRRAVGRLERGKDRSGAARQRAREAVQNAFASLREALLAREETLLRDTDALFELEAGDVSRRLDDLVSEGQRLSKAAAQVAALSDGPEASNATLASLNQPLLALLDALESSAQALEREEALVAQQEGSAGRPGSPVEGEASGLGRGEDRGIRCHFCPDPDVLRKIESMDLVRFDGATPPVVLIGTPEAVGEEARRRNLTRGQPRLTHRFGSAGGNETTYESAYGLSDDIPKLGASSEYGAGKGWGDGVDDEEEEDEKIGTRSFAIKAITSYEEGGGHKGVVYYLGTRGGEQPFSNPAIFSPEDENLVVLRASSQIEGDLASLVAFKHYDGAFFETDSAQRSWVSIEFPFLLSARHYTLGYYIRGEDHIPRNWVLQGSRDNSSWITLRVHENDTSLDQDSHLATWKIPEKVDAGPYRFFRILQTGPTSSGTMFLVLSFIEFYGTLYHESD